MPHALIVDDDSDTLNALAELVRLEGFTADAANSLQQARISMGRQRPDVVLLDLTLPDGDGMDLFEDIESRENTQIVLITGNASIETSVQALRLGATDYLIKPINFKQIKNILARVARPGDLKSEIHTLRDELRRLGRFGHLMGSSSAMQVVYDQIGRVAPTAATVLITGESGTGKELVAQTLHDLSNRHKFPFLAVNCGAISPQLIESEMFGHEKGSFTGATREHKGHFERASGGTLFLDEVTEMPVELQVKLLRILETGRFMRVGSDREIETDVRVIAATNRNPEEAVAAGKLREDLLYRLQVFPLQLPPLRNRGDDVEQLALQFLDVLNAKEEQRKTFSKTVLDKLKVYNWPGNVRELKNVVHRAFIMANEQIDLNCLPAELGVSAEPKGPTFTVRVGCSIASVEQRLIMATLEEYSGNKERVAETLGISLKTLYNRLHEYEDRETATAELN
ncbi:MAG: Response regulator containing CheY-like receiver, AAA-type ATPase, and DNA-binding domain [Verrucomicrobiaceae bacterium]|nr:Response regulator containing CheY-like receiver, AAA-type ATPase, and DNA-binding domain [Verrucomicrobiaceae bacterium]